MFFETLLLFFKVDPLQQFDLILIICELIKWFDQTEHRFCEPKVRIALTNGCYMPSTNLKLCVEIIVVTPFLIVNTITITTR